MRRALLALLCASTATTLPRSAVAQEPPPPPATEARPDEVAPRTAPVSRAIDRTWLYGDDARIPAPLQVILTNSVSYTNVGSPTRLGSGAYNALGMNTAQPGAMVGIGGEIGLFSRVSIMTNVQVGFGGEGQLGANVKVPSPNAGLVAGVRVRAFPDAWKNTRLVVSAGYLREAWQGPVFDDDSRAWKSGKPYGDSGAWLQVAFSQDIADRVRVAATVHAEHVFADGRDPVDIMVEAGVSARIVGGFRLGVEYVGQDLEEAADAGAEGGVRHFIGPIASLQVLRDRLSIVAGPSFGLSHLSPEILGRAAASFGF